MENEENRGLIDKKAFEDQLVPFINSIFELFLYSLSHTLGHLEFSWNILALSQEGGKQEKVGQGKERKEKFKQGI